MNQQTEQIMKNQIIRCGNNAHNLRNILYQIFDDQIPDIAILSDEASRIEGICFDIIRTNLNFRYLSYFEGWKVALKKIKRHIKVSQRLISTTDQSTYHVFSEKIKDELLQNLKLQEEITENVDSYINNLFIEFSDKKSEQFQYKETISNEIYNQMNFDELNQKQLDESNILKLSDAVQAALEACNRAHNIQNYSVPYQQKQGFQDSANIIVGNCGEIENQFREIQKQLMTNAHINDMKNELRNKANYAKTKIEHISQNIKQLEKDSKFTQSNNLISACQIIGNACDFFSSKITDDVITCCS